MEEIKGFNILLDLHDCDQDKLDNYKEIKENLSAIVKKSDFKIVGEKYHKFKPYGVTGVILLASSHVSVHTWPELGFVAVDIYSCKGFENAKKIADDLIKFFGAKRVESKEIVRFR